jgi:hypothetical protein
MSGECGPGARCSLARLVARLCGETLWRDFVARLCGETLWRDFVARLCGETGGETCGRTCTGGWSSEATVPCFGEACGLWRGLWRDLVARLGGETCSPGSSRL